LFRIACKVQKPAKWLDFPNYIRAMTDDRKAGIALILGTIGGIVTMAMHPVGSGSLTASQAQHLALVSAIAHSLAIVSFVPMFLGALRLTLRLTSRETHGNEDRLSITALVTYALAIVAILIAASVSGFIVPASIRHMVADDPAYAPQWKIAISAIFQFNQAFARIYSIATSVAIVLWSASALRNGGLGRGVATYGCILPPIVIVLIAVGHLKLDVHGMAVVVLVQAIWFIVAALHIYKHPDQIAAQPR
jgi:hypothetical protein